MKVNSYKIGNATLNIYVMKVKNKLAPHVKYLSELNKRYIDMSPDEKKHYHQLRHKSLYTCKTEPINHKLNIDREKTPHHLYLKSLNKRYVDLAEDEMKQYCKIRRRFYYVKSKDLNIVDQKEKMRKWLRHQVKGRKIKNGYKTGTCSDWIKNAGCTRDEFITYIESLFTEGMTWDNWSYDGWHMDHIHPLSKGGTNHYTNLQPLWAADNLAKSNKLVH
tara:strand:+ start:334 stop:990 length:657 start_codon:yes stop_codon:yes gene_type:complete